MLPLSLACGDDPAADLKGVCRACTNKMKSQAYDLHVDQLYPQQLSRREQFK
jgi:hypothetical protein